MYTEHVRSFSHQCRSTLTRFVVIVISGTNYYLSLSVYPP